MMAQTQTMEPGQVLLFLILSALVGWFCKTHAERQGRSGGLWFTLGFIFGVMALLTLLALPYIQQYISDRGGNAAPSTGHSKRDRDSDAGRPTVFARDGAQWHVAPDDEPEGPYEEEQVLDMLHAGRITLDTFVWATGLKQWMPAKEVGQLLDA